MLKIKDALRRTVSCGHKSASFDGIKLSMTKLRGYIVIAPLRLLACLLACLLKNGTGNHVCQALFLTKFKKIHQRNYSRILYVTQGVYRVDSWGFAKIRRLICGDFGKDGESRLSVYFPEGEWQPVPLCSRQPGRAKSKARTWQAGQVY